MASFENVTYVACGIGQNDISIQVVAKDTSEIYYFVTEVVRKVPGVRKTTTSIVPIILKDVYQWRVPERIANEFSESELLTEKNNELRRFYVWFKDASITETRAKNYTVGGQL
ncbi:MAG: Lrp/AsnC family transcriptional regulator [Anaerolineales bacterium]|nr:Lrp/AsnC family transcriptional regulator [Anaerolineales bacterium]